MPMGVVIEMMVLLYVRILTDETADRHLPGLRFLSHLIFASVDVRRQHSHFLHLGLVTLGLM